MEKAMSSRARRTDLSSPAGFTIVEVMVAAMLLLVGMLGVASMVDQAGRSTLQSKTREGGTNLAREILEQTRTLQYTDLNTAAMTPKLQALPGLAGVSQTPWVIERRGVRYTITASVCALDDPRDGNGVHTAGGFCTGQTAADADPTPADYKEVTIQAAWTDGGTQKSIRQKTLIATNGAADAPAVTSLKATSAVAGTPTEPMITSTATTTVTFQAEATTNADTVYWSLDGVEMGTATLSAGKWTFTLNLSNPAPPPGTPAPPPLGDGTWEIGARAADAAGAEGATFTIPLRLIRGPSAAPSSVRVGPNVVYDNGSPVEAVELDWLETKARNVVGYRVYRNGTTLICPANTDALVTRPECVDLTPGSATTYKVVSLYVAADGTVQEGGSVTVPMPAAVGTALYLSSTGATATSACPAGLGARDMQFTAPAAQSTLSIGGSWTVHNFCTKTTETFDLKATNVTARLRLANSHNAQNCSGVTASVGINGVTSTSAPQTVPKNTSAGTWLAFPLTLPRNTLVAGERLQLRVNYGDGGCKFTDLVLGGANPSAFDIPVGSPKPDAPVAPKIVAATGGGTDVTWTAPTGGATPVAFYRLYAEGTNYTQRIDRTGDATTLKLTDPERSPASGVRYWVTAVSADLAESPAVEATP